MDHYQNHQSGTHPTKRALNCLSADVISLQLAHTGCASIKVTLVLLRSNFTCRSLHQINRSIESWSALMTLSQSRLHPVCLLLLAALLCACGPKPSDAPPGQALASVNGVEITALQLNEELARAGVGAVERDAASKQLLQALIDRQLLQSEAAREKLDRDPKVMQAIDRARALIVAQAWLQKHIGNLAHPTSADIESYFYAHPAFFGSRKQFTMDQLQLPPAALTASLKKVIDNARSLDDVTEALAASKAQAARSRVTRSTADLAPALANRLLAMRKGQVFAVQERNRALVIALVDVQEAPVTLAMARPQIEQFLFKQRQKESAAAEVARLRADAKIEYLNKTLAETPPVQAGQVSNPPSAGQGAASITLPPANAATTAVTASNALDRGVAGLK
jgi:peptidyl-prolyl cis-trans isomerase C